MPTELIKKLQYAARALATTAHPGVLAATVQILDLGGRVLVAIAIPPHDVCGPTPELEAVSGWHLEGGKATYDGAVIAVAPSRLKLLAVLAKASDPLTAKELNRLAFKGESNEESVRHHIRKLREEIRAGVADFEGDVIANEGDGYTLALK